MNLSKISNFIKTKRKNLGITQEELAEKLFVTEKAVSRWETGRGTPDISLLMPLSKILKVDVSELLNGEDNKKNNNDIEKLIEYGKLTKATKFNLQFKLIILLYILSILLFLVYLRYEYNPSIELNYFLRLFIIIISSCLVIIGNIIYGNNYVEKLEDKKRVTKFSQIIIFGYYLIFLFNMVFFARYSSIDSYNIIPFKSIIQTIFSLDLYNITINIFGNFFVFMPLEYFIVELFDIKKLVFNFLLSLIIIFGIEVFQLVFKVGVFDIDDIILEILGMMIFFYIINNYLHK